MLIRYIMARLLAITVFERHASALSETTAVAVQRSYITVFARHASAVSEKHGNSRNRGIYHHPWFNHGKMTAVQCPRTALEETTRAPRKKLNTSKSSVRKQKEYTVWPGKVSPLARVSK